MIDRPRVVVDNNVLVSRLLVPASIPGLAVRKAVDSGQLLISEATLLELAGVLSRPKFDPYLTIADRQQFIRLVGRIAERVTVVDRIQVCRDPKDNMILEVAVNGAANLIVTGDRDLLALATCRDIPIITPLQYVKG